MVCAKKIHPVACFLSQILLEHYYALSYKYVQQRCEYFLSGPLQKISAYHYSSIQLLLPLELCDFRISCIYPHISLCPLFLCW